ncbi:MAG TPA: NADP-dependent oxidoreductase [Streptosporangiaceae bacterium]|nr:NADP-dependent oxidoreductase [Streptosporangiaceae bacterium]
MAAGRQWIACDFGGPEVLRLRDVEVAPPGPGEVTIGIRASGMNPADYKHLGPGQDRSVLPLTLGYESAGIITAVGPGTEIATGGGAVGDEVVAFQILGGYASAITVPASDVFAKPGPLSFAQAANLLLAATTAAELLATAGVSESDTVLLHGAAGAVGMSVLQQARLLGARVIGTASEDNFGVVEGFGGVPVTYGDGLEERVRHAAGTPIAAVLDTVGSDEAVDSSLALLNDRRRLVTLTAFHRASAEGFTAIGASNPASGPFRAQARRRMIELAAAGNLTVPVARTFPFEDARDAVAMLARPHPSGKLALVLEG